MALNNVHFIEEEVACTPLASGANAVMNLPAQTVVMAAGKECTEALAGASASTTATSLPGMAYLGAEDTIDINVDTLTGTATGGKICVWAIVVDVGGRDADEVDRDYLS